MRTNHLPLCALALLMAAGCSDDFEAYNHLSKLRLLAIKSEPAAPAPGETAKLSALVYAPPGTPVTYAWSWCPLVGGAETGYPCLVGETSIAGALPAFDLGAGEQAALPHTIDPALVRALCAGSVNGVVLPAVPDCRGGLAVTVRLTLRTPEDTVTAVRTVRLRPDAADPDANPTIDGVAALLPDGMHPLDDSGAVTLPRATEVALAAQVPDASAERFTEIREGQPVAVRERLLLTWFIDAGETHDPRTSFIDGVVPLGQALANRWTLPAATSDGRGSARLMVVVRDSRGGVAWRTATVAMAMGGAL